VHTKLAAKLLLLTMVCKRELTDATCDELDLEEDVCLAAWSARPALQQNAWRLKSSQQHDSVLFITRRPGFWDENN
jgi:hypothetical protein